jgi:hypothetical protein
MRERVSASFDTLPRGAFHNAPRWRPVAFQTAAVRSDADRLDGSHPSLAGCRVRDPLELRIVSIAPVTRDPISSDGQ